MTDRSILEDRKIVIPNHVEPFFYIDRNADFDYRDISLTQEGRIFDARIVVNENAEAYIALDDSLLEEINKQHAEDRWPLLRLQRNGISRYNITFLPVNS